MCVVSMIMDHYQDKWHPRLPQPAPVPMPLVPYPVLPVPMITPEEVEEFRRLLERAREYDRKNHEPECELDEKKRAVKDLAEKLGVKIDFL
jgi:hypothetical protein